MKRDMDLCRAILLKVEEAEPMAIVDIRPENFDGRSMSELGEHVQLLQDDGLVEANFRMGGQSIQRLTARGHDFLALARNESIWNNAKQRIRALGAGLTIQSLTHALKVLVSEGLDKVL